MTRDETISIIKEIMHYAYDHWMFEGDHEYTAEEILEHELKIADNFDIEENLLYLISWCMEVYECFDEIQDKVYALLAELKTIAKRTGMTYKKYIITGNYPDNKWIWKTYVSIFDSSYPSMNEAMQKQYVEKTYPYRFFNNAWI